MHPDPVTATVVAGGFLAAAAASASPALDPLVLVSAVTALGAVATAIINGRMTRQNANIAALRDDADTARKYAAAAGRRAEVAEERADTLASELDGLRREFNHMSNQFSTLILWSRNVAARHDLEPPPIPE